MNEGYLYLIASGEYAGQNEPLMGVESGSSTTEGPLASTAMTWECTVDGIEIIVNEWIDAQDDSEKESFKNSWELLKVELSGAGKPLDLDKLQQQEINGLEHGNSNMLRSVLKLGPQDSAEELAKAIKKRIPVTYYDGMDFSTKAPNDSCFVYAIEKEVNQAEKQFAVYFIDPDQEGFAMLQRCPYTNATDVRPLVYSELMSAAPDFCGYAESSIMVDSYNNGAYKYITGCNVKKFQDTRIGAAHNSDTRIGAVNNPDTRIGAAHDPVNRSMDSCFKAVMLLVQLIVISGLCWLVVFPKIPPVPALPPMPGPFTTGAPAPAPSTYAPTPPLASMPAAGELQGQKRKGNLLPVGHRVYFYQRVSTGGNEEAEGDQRQEPQTPRANLRGA